MTACRTRGTLAAGFDASRVGEQSLTRRLVDKHPEAFGEGRLVIMDRNFPGYRLIEAVRVAGAHVLIRIKAGIGLPVAKILPDGSYLTVLHDRRRRCCMMLRVVEYNVSVLGREEVSETFTLATSLLDPDQWTPADLREVYPLRWSGAETTTGENKSAITDAGPSRGPMLRSRTPHGVAQEFWAWLATGQLIRAAGAQATTAANTGQIPVGAPSQPRDVTRDPVACCEISFTTTRRAVGASIWRTTPPTTAALAAQADTTATVILSELLQLDRQRRKPRRVKWRPGFPHTRRTLLTHKGSVRINPFPLTAHPDTS
jgi:hypothetical protein